MKFLPLQQCVPQSHLSEDGIIVQCKNKLPVLRRLMRPNVNIERPRGGGVLLRCLETI